MKVLKSPFIKLLLLLIAILIIGEGKFINLLGKKNEEIDLIAVGDTGTGGEAQYKVGRVIGKTCSKDSCVGIVILGDVIYPNGVSSTNDPQFQTKFELIYRDIFKPFYIALGNHDYHGCVECEIAYSTMSAKWKLPSRYYKESFGDLVDLLVIDTEKLDRRQIDWVVNELKTSKAKWKIVAGHRPLTSYDERHGSSEEERKPLLEEIICQKADLYLAGHDHGLQDIGDHCGVRLFTIGGGGGPVGKIAKDSLPFTLSDYGFAKIKVNNKKISVEFINIEGKIIYRWFKERKD